MFSNPDSLLNRILLQIGDIILLNFLFLLCSIPIVTIGASTTALYYSCMKLVKNDGTIVSKNFLYSFRQNFKQATCIWICFLFFGIVLLFNIQFLRNQISTYAAALTNLSYFICIIFFFELLYIFPVLAAFENKTKLLLKNAFLFAYIHIPSTILMTLLWIIPLSFTFTDYTFMPLYLFCWFFFGFAALAFLCSFLFYRIFQPHLSQKIRH